MFEDLPKYIGGSLAVLAAAAWLIKALVGHYLSKYVEKYKAELELQVSLGTERLRRESQASIMEHPVRFTKAYEQVFETIVEVHRPGNRSMGVWRHRT